MRSELATTCCAKLPGTNRCFGARRLSSTTKLQDQFIWCAIIFAVRVPMSSVLLKHGKCALPHDQLSRPARLHVRHCRRILVALAKRRNHPEEVLLSGHQKTV